MNDPKSKRSAARRSLDWLVGCFRRTRFSVGSVTLRRNGIWAEVTAIIDGREVLLIREIHDNNFNHTITKTGMISERYPANVSSETRRPRSGRSCLDWFVGPFHFLSKNVGIPELQKGADNKDCGAANDRKRNNAYWLLPPVIVGTCVGIFLLF